MVHSHRSTLKQSNKPFKGKGSGISKSKGKEAAKAKVQQKAHSAMGQSMLSKKEKRNQSNQLKSEKEKDSKKLKKIFENGKAHQVVIVEKVARKDVDQSVQDLDNDDDDKMDMDIQNVSSTNPSTTLTINYAAPKHCAIIPLCPDLQVDTVLANLFTSYQEKFHADDKENAPSLDLMNGCALLEAKKFNQSLGFYPASRDLISALDTSKIADVLLFVVSAVEEVDAFGEQLMTCIKSQGVPASVVVLVQHLNTVPPKKQMDVKKSLLYYMNHHFAGDLKLYSMDNQAECLNCIRQLTSQYPTGISWRDRYAYISGQEWSFECNDTEPDYGILKVTGYVRGSSLSANRLVHIPEYGDFQVDSILHTPPSNRIRGDMDMEEVVLHKADPDICETLVDQNEPDPMDAEQTWPTEEEIDQANKLVQQQTQLQQLKKRVPKGTSSYQAAWILEDDAEGQEVPDSDNEMAPEFEKDGEEQDTDDAEEYEDVELDNRSVKFDVLDDEENEEQLKEYLKKQQSERDEMQFPDEVDTPQFMAASQRFAKYRGLKSFKSSPWDPYENLPIDYARIFQFQNFRRSKKKVLDTSMEGVPVGVRVTILIKNVPSRIQAHDPSKLLTIFGLLPYEHKMSIMNFTVKREKSFTRPIKSKDPMILMVGFRRYVVNPIYSTYTRGGPNNVHKFERFLHSDRTSMATIYAPIQFGPAPIMMFDYSSSSPISWNNPEKLAPLVGTGSLLEPQPLRIIAKRIILTGHPFKIHKRGAVVRFMFYSPQDVDWFKPVQLHTKYGRVGHIKESLGTHGYMKCQFDQGIKQHDTVCMNLYKRVFPKWTTRIFTVGEEREVDEEMEVEE